MLKKQELAFKAVADNNKKKLMRERIRTFRGAATKAADTVGNSTCAMGSTGPTPCNVETSVNLAAAGDASAARARRVYKSPHVRKQTLTWHGMSMGTITTSLCIQRDVQFEV